MKNCYPTGGFKVILEEVTIDNTKKMLCQRCSVRETFRSRDKGASARGFSIEKFFKKIFS
jgi:hypothetical protein